MMRNPKKFCAILFLLALLVIAVVFHCMNAPIERDTVEMQSQQSEAWSLYEKESESRMAEQLAQLTWPENWPEPTEPPAFSPLDVPLDAVLQHEISGMCQEAGVPFEVVMGLAWVESRFQANAVSKTNDHGLTQINQCNLGWLRDKGITDIYDPVQNVRACLLIIGPVWAKHEPNKALMCYQYGETRAGRKWAKGQTTSSHSRKVLARAEVYGWGGGDINA